MERFLGATDLLKGRQYLSVTLDTIHNSFWELPYLSPTAASGVNNIHPPHINGSPDKSHFMIQMV